MRGEICKFQTGLKKVYQADSARTDRLTFDKDALCTLVSHLDKKVFIFYAF